MGTLNNSTQHPTQGKLIFSPEDSPASHTAQPESDLEKKMTATSGQRCLELFEKSSRDTLWGKMLAASLVGMEGWYSTRCRLIWKLKGTKYGRLYFQLAPSTLHTDATEFGLLLTPRATTIEETQEQFAQRMNKHKKKDRKNGFPNLQAQVIGLLKTPTKMDGEVSSGKANPVSGNSGTLAQEIMSGYAPTMEKIGLLPTPAAQDGKNATLPQSQAFRDTVPGAVMRNQTFQTGEDSQLNPRFVAEMMGFPVDWLELPFQNTDVNL
jgi:hypothetical protein